MTLTRDSMLLARAILEVEQAKETGSAEEEHDALERMADVIRHKPTLWRVVYDSLKQQMES